MKVLAIGATGFIGSQVVQQLMLKGHQVALFHRRKTRASELKSLVHFCGHRNELTNFKAEFKQFAPDVVLDCIPYTQAQAQDVVQVFRDCTQRLVAISSGDVYRNYEGLQEKGKHLPNPIPLAKMHRSESRAIRIGTLRNWILSLSRTMTKSWLSRG
ncbi:MAG: NAD-dependent epimerase/dehydratase family protein [Leptolyngbyaceae cyanobacterium CSU_1_3]|nr:NAD-dependent epimerase/dehydratase family protein [Leptolyngbyaceae cyanobacterium CSU_1_3]